MAEKHSTKKYRARTQIGAISQNSTTALAGTVGFTIASAATAVVEFMVNWLN